MSLTQSVTLSTGVTVTFWTLNQLILNAVTQLATITMTGYLDSDSFLNGNDSVTSTFISIQFVPTNTLPGGVTVLQAIYNKIGLDPFFSGSIYTNDGH